MKPGTYRFWLFLFIVAFLPLALLGGRDEGTSAVLRRKAPFTTDGLQTRAARTQNKTQQQQGEQVVIRFIRDPDAAPAFAVKGIDGSTVNLAGARGKVVLLN